MSLPDFFTVDFLFRYPHGCCPHTKWDPGKDECIGKFWRISLYFERKTPISCLKKIFLYVYQRVYKKGKSTG